MVGGRVAIDSRAARYFWQRPYFPSWFVPVGDVDDALVPSGVTVTDDRLPGHVHVPWPAG